MIEGLHINSPLIEGDELSNLLGVKVLLKMDSLQPSGSFKIRGISHRCIKAIKESNCNHIVCSSGGNAGMAAAYSGRKLGIKTTIVVPTTTPQFMIDKIRAEGATVELHGRIWNEADELARSIVEKDSQAAYIHPFDHEDVWEGHSSIIEEIYDQVKSTNKETRQPKAIVTVVGGGGLLCGILVGLDKVGWNNVPIIAVETEGAASFARAMELGQHIAIDDITSIAKTLGAKKVCEGVWKRSFEQKTASGLPRVQPYIVSDAIAVDACLKFADHQRTLVEPACGAGLSAVYQRASPLMSLLSETTSDDYVVVIVCGGNMVSLQSLADWKTQFGL